MRGTAAVKLKVVLERTDTIIKQAQLIVEASTVEEARQIVLGDLDAGVYDADCIVFQKEQPISLWDSATICRRQRVQLTN